MKNGGDLVKAFQEGLLLFNSSSIYIDAMAANHANTSAVSEVGSCSASVAVRWPLAGSIVRGHAQDWKSKWGICAAACFQSCWYMEHFIWASCAIMTKVAFVWMTPIAERVR